jgi:hypothetical protein
VWTQEELRLNFNRLRMKHEAAPLKGSGSSQRLQTQSKRKRHVRHAQDG